MTRSLARILRLRALIEEESRLKLEKLAHDAYRIEQAQDAERSLASACKASAFSLIPENHDQAGKDDLSRWEQSRAHEAWLTALKDGDLAVFREKRLQALAILALQRLEAGREEMLQLRKEKQQLEIQIHNEQKRRETEMERSRQRTLDDWYAAKLHQRRVRRGRTQG